MSLEDNKWMLLWCIRIPAVQQLCQCNSRIHVSCRAAAGKQHPLKFLLCHIQPPLPDYPFFGGFICRETLRITPISAIWISSAVPP